MSAGILDGSDASPILFDDAFDVADVNPEGKKFDKVDRIICKSHTYDVDMMIDIASEPFPVKVGERLSMLLTTTLRKDGKPDDEAWDSTMSSAESLLDQYDYGMHGKVFKVEHSGESQVTILASFGGLMMLLKGQPVHLNKIKIDTRIYCLIRKASSSDAAA